MPNFQILTPKWKTVFVYKLFGKRDKCPFFIVKIPHFSSNIPFTISYGSIFSELSRIASCTLRNNDFLSTVSDLVSGMIANSANRAALAKKLKKAFQRCPNFSQKVWQNSRGNKCQHSEEHFIVEISKPIFIELDLMDIKIHLTE